MPLLGHFSSNRPTLFQILGSLQFNATLVNLRCGSTALPCDCTEVRIQLYCNSRAIPTAVRVQLDITCQVASEMQ